MDYDLPGANGMRRLRRLENILHAFEARLLLHRGKRNEIRRVQRDVYPVLLRKPWKQRRGLFRKADSPAALYLVTVQPKPGKVLRKLLGEFASAPNLISNLLSVKQ